MNIYTETAEAILQSEGARRIYDSLSPIYGEAYVGLWLMQVIGMELDDFQTWSEDFLLQVTPSTATWTIEFWEASYNIAPDPNMSLEARRKAIENKMLTRAPVNPAKIKQIVQNIAGVDADLNENVSKNKFEVIIRRNIDINLIEKIEKTIDEIKPAHIIYDLKVALLFEAFPPVYVGTFVSQHLQYKIEVIS